jgi:iron complex outermembrane recepter protein
MPCYQRMKMLTTLWCCVLLLTSVTTTAEESSRYHFDIGPQNVEQALRKLANVTNCRLLFPYDSVENLTSSSISGQYTLEGALKEIIKGTPLSGELTEDGVMLITLQQTTSEKRGDVKMKSKKNILATAIAFIISSAGVQAQEQESAAETGKESPDLVMEEVVVTGGYRKSLEKALDLKRFNVNFSDSIVATDIADFPDQNLAEALQRIPGVSIERDKGIGTKVNVRSLGVEYTHATINNVSTSSGSGGRDVNFDIFASELIQSVTVKKSPLASDEEGGVAGVISIETARPFDYDGFKFVASSEAAYNSLSEETDPRYSFLVSNTYDKWGFLLSYAAEDRTNRTDQADTAEFRELGRNRGNAADNAREATLAEALAGGDSEDVANAKAEAAADAAFAAAIPDGTDAYVYPENIRDDIFISEQEKWGASGAIQFRPNDNLEFSLDLMAGNYQDHEQDYLFGSWSGASTTVSNLVVDSTTVPGLDVITSGTFDNVQHEFKSYDRYRDESYKQASLSMDWQIEDWTVKAMLGYSGAKRDYQRTQAKWTRYEQGNQYYVANGMDRSSDVFDMANDVSGYEFVFWDFDNTKVKDDKYVFQADFTRQFTLSAFPALQSVQFGTRYSEKSMTHDHGWTEVKGETVIPGEAGRQSTSEEWSGDPIPAEFSVPVSDVIPGGDFMSDMPGKFDNWQVIPNAWARDKYYIDGLKPNYFHSDHYQVDEDVTALYAMADFEFGIAGLPARLNVGVRGVSTSQSSFGFQQVDGQWSDAPIKFESDYNDVLPNLNMTVDLMDDLFLRFAAAKVMSRATLGQLSGKRSISTNSLSIDRGNPDLEPLRADQFDLGLEWYFTEGSLLAITYFYKDLESFITKANIGQELYQGELYDVRTFVNGKGSTIQGTEIIVQFPFSAFVDSLEGFGINANYTMVDSTVGHVSDFGLKVPMFGLSEDSYNVTVYFENESFDARVSYNYKGESVQSIEDNLYPVYREGYGQVDLSLGYQINDNFKLTAKAINVTDEALSEYMMDPAFPKKYQVSGSRYSLGVRYTF